MCRLIPRVRDGQKFRLCPKPELSVPKRSADPDSGPNLESCQGTDPHARPIAPAEWESNVRLAHGQWPASVVHGALEPRAAITKEHSHQRHLQPTCGVLTCCDQATSTLLCPRVLAIRRRQHLLYSARRWPGRIRASRWIFRQPHARISDAVFTLSEAPRRHAA